MLEKEILTKKRILKSVYPPTAPIIALAICGPFFAFFFYFSAELFFMVELTITNFFGYIMIGCSLFMAGMTLVYLLSPLATFINLHRGKYYVVVAPLMNKEAGGHLEFTSAGFKKYNKYFFSFADYGSYKKYEGDTLIEIASDSFYKFSKINKMSPRIAFLTTEIGEEFYLLIRGGKRKKIVHIFHKKLFELQKDEFTQLYNRYYI